MEKLCSVKECTNLHCAKGFCQKHYVRFKRYGDPQIIHYPNYKHGYLKEGRKHSLYKIWSGMKTRCYNKNREKYKNHGGRDIKVCNEWKESPRKFIEWALNNGWELGLYIDRINNNGDYEPMNCRFVTPQESALNKRLIYSNNLSEYRGVSKKGNKWVAQIGINNKQRHLGYFNSPRIAALRYDVAAYLNGDNRPRNFIY